MADIRLDLGLDVTQQSVREIQRAINNAVRNTTAELDFDVEDSIRRINQRINSQSFNLEKIGISKDFENEVQERISNLKVRFSDVDLSRAARDSIQRSLERTRFELEASLTPRRQPAGAPGGVGGQFRARTQEDEIGTGVLELKELEQRSKLALAEEQLAEAREKQLRQVTSSINKELTAVQRNARATSELADIREAFRNEQITAQQARKSAERVQPTLGAQNAGRVASARQELLAEIDADIASEKELRSIRDNLKGAYERNVAAQKRELDVSRKNFESIERLDSARDRLRRGLINASEAEREAARVSPQGEETAPLREAVQGRLQVLLAEIDADIASEKELRSIRDNLRGAYERNIAAQKRELDVSRKNFESIERLDSVRDRLRRGLINASEAEREVARVSPQGEETAPLREAVQRRLQVLNQEVETAKRQEEVVQQGIRVQRQVNKENKANQGALDKLARIREDLARREISSSQALSSAKGIRETGTGESAERVARERDELISSIRDGIALNKQLNELQEQEFSIRKRELQTLKEKVRKTLIETGLTEQQIRASRDVVTRLRQFGASLNRGGTGPGPGQVNLADPGSIGKLTADLDTRQLQELSNILRGVSSGSKDAQRQLERFSNSNREANDTQERLNRNLRTGQTSMANFGREVSVAARRLIAWSIPAAIIFNTIQALQEAVRQVIQLDTEVRRLVFFAGGGTQFTAETQKNLEGIGATFREVGDSSEELEKPVAQLNRLAQATEGATDQAALYQAASQAAIDVAQDQGLAIEQVSEAFVTSARVGQDFISVLEGAEGTTRAAISQFNEAALSLVRLSGGAVNSEEAVRGLQAIQAQFFGGQRGNFFSGIADSGARAQASLDALSNAQRLLSVTASQASADESDLIDAVTRLGSAFVNLQGLNFSQTIAILGESFTATGATTGRLATALRQMATLISQNSENIKEIANIDVAASDGTLRGFEAILDVLEEIRASTGTLRATELSLQIADRRNVADIQALAANVDSLRDSFEQFADPAERINTVAQAAVSSFKANQSVASSLESAINRLRNSFVSLIQGAEFQTLFKTILNLGTDVVGTFEDIISVVNDITPIVKTSIALFSGIGIGALAIGAIKAFNAIREAVNAMRQLGGATAQVTQLLSNQGTVVQGITKAQEAGLITTGQKQRLQKQIITAQAQEARGTARLTALEQKLVNLDVQDVNFGKQKARIQRQILKAQQQINAARAQGQRVVSRTNSLLVDQQRTQQRQARNRAALGSLGTGLLLVGPQLEEALEGHVSEGVISGVSQAGGLIATGASLGGFPGAIAGVVAAAFALGFEQFVKERSAEVENAALDVAVAPRNLRQSAQVGLATATEEGIQFQIESLAKGDEQRKQLEERLKIIRNLTGEDKRAVDVAAERLRNARNYLRELEDQAVKTGKLTGFERERLEFFRGVVGEATQIVEETVKEAQERRRVLERDRRITELRNEQNRLTADLASNSLDANEAVRAREELQKNANELTRLEIENLEASKKAEEDLLLTEERRRRLLAEINREQAIQQQIRAAIQALPQTEEEAIKIGIQFEQSDFNQQISEFSRQLQLLEDERRALALSGDFEKIEDIVERIQTKRQEAELASISRFASIIETQREILDATNQRVLDQIEAWEDAQDNVVGAMGDVIKAQEGLADRFGAVGEAVSRIFEDTASSISNFLEGTGASLSRRFSVLATNASNQLKSAASTFELQSSTFGERFLSGQQLQANVSNLLTQIGEVIRTSDRKILDERKAAVDLELAQTRANLRIQRQLFDLRIQETRREIDVRQDLLDTEIEIIQNRFEAERELNTLRREQQEEFGRLLLDSPEQFQEAIRNINLATRFFDSVTNINIDGLRTIVNRIQRTRGAGQLDLLRQVVEGIEQAQRFGRPEIIEGVGNAQLQSIFERLQIGGIEGVSRDLRRQQREANEQTRLQQAIRERQQAQVRLAETDVALQQAQLQVERQFHELASAQRDLQNERLNELIGVSEQTRNDFISGLSALTLILGAGNEEIQKLTRGGGDFTNRIVNVLEAIGPQRTSQNLQDIAREVQQNFLDALTGGRGSEGDAERRREDAEARQRVENARQEAAAINSFDEQVREANRALIEFQTNLQPGQTDTRGFDTLDAGSLIDTLQSQFRAGEGGRNFRFVSRELQELLARQSELRESGGALSTREQEELRRLRQESRQFGTFGISGEGGRQAARRLLGEDSERRIVRSFRELLQDTPSEKDFIDAIRDLRGEGRRDIRTIDVDTVRQVLAGQGFTGVARGISTRGQAADVLDRFIGLADELKKQQGEISRETRQQIVNVLGRELTEGVKGLVDAGVEEIRRSGETAAAKAITDVVIQEREVEKLRTAIRQGAEEGSRNFADRLKIAFSEAAGETQIRIDLSDLGIDVNATITQSIEDEGFTEALRQALINSGLENNALIDTLSRRLSVVIKSLVEKGIIPADVGF